jgi:hypothetical protein
LGLVERLLLKMMQWCTTLSRPTFS